MQAEEIPGGAVLTVNGGGPVLIRALEFIGVMTVECTTQPITLPCPRAKTRTRTETTRRSNPA